MRALPYRQFALQVLQDLLCRSCMGGSVLQALPYKQVALQVLQDLLWSLCLGGSVWQALPYKQFGFILDLC